MVVAEIPLWVVHDSGTVTAATPTATTTKNHHQQDNNNEINHHHHPPDSTTTTITKSAVASLQLLHPESHAKKKCAVYSLDMHPDGTKFATAGGDGTVRLWNANALFRNHHHHHLSQQNKQRTTTTTPPKGAVSKYQAENGTYISTDYSSNGGNSSSSNNSSSSDEGEGGEATNGKQQPPKKDESSSSSSSIEEPNSHPTLAEAHDLSAVVRRKKNGEKMTTTTTSTSLPNSPTSNNNNNKKNSPSKITTPSKHHHHPHRLLCTLSAHTGSSVLVVRFSNNGQFLASGSDDACVCIYAPSTASAVGNLTTTTTKTIEHWSRIRLCRGHNLDVVDLAWSPDDTYLVSCSLDSDTPVIVWNVRDLKHSTTTGSKGSMILNPHKILGKHEHTSTVKGVAFDPAGSYLASSGDDPAICIWRTSDSNSGGGGGGNSGDNNDDTNNDDWGLEQRIDASAGIFRQWASSSSSDGTTTTTTTTTPDPTALSNQSLFRRISWSTDGAFVCSTNSVVKNKHVLSTISRQGWNTATANLVGHKQPIVVCRHASQLLNNNNNCKKKEEKQQQKESTKKTEDNNDNVAHNNDDDDDEEEPDYATLLAMGDRRGFVTVWSTRKSRPIFKLQCSESRCTVTDLSWGTVPTTNDLVLLVSLLDGQVVALKFAVPDELGHLLTPKDKARVFQLRYGIDMDEGSGLFLPKRMFASSGRHKFIENPLQMTLEDTNLENENNNNNSKNDDPFRAEDNHHAATTSSAAAPNVLMGRSVKNVQQESRSIDGKKRVRPVLMQIPSEEKRLKPSEETTKTTATTEVPTDPLVNAMDVANRAETTADGSTRRRAAGDDFATETTTTTENGPTTTTTTTTTAVRTSAGRHATFATTAVATAALPHSTDRIHTVDLPVSPETTTDTTMQIDNDDDKTLEKQVLVAECKNNLKVPLGSKGTPIPCMDLSISKNGKVSWRDQIPGTSCCSIAASKQILAVGTTDGSIQFYGTSPTTGWACGNGFRSHPPLVFGHPIVSMQMKEENGCKMDDDSSTTDRIVLVVVTADGSFGVYTVLPELSLLYKGSIIPAMSHMAIGLSANLENRILPKLSRIQLTDTGRLLLMLSFQHVSSTTARHHVNERTTSRSGGAMETGVGGSLQAFVYNKPSELWMRISDSRFVLSDFYSTLPSSRITGQVASKQGGILARMDDSVRIGSMQSSLKATHRGRFGGDRQGVAIYSNQAEDDVGTFIPSRSHCEDRMACALALGSTDEFKYWLSMYVKTLAMAGHATQLRMIADMLLGGEDKHPKYDSTSCWWLSEAPRLLSFERRALVKSLMIPEMSKNRALQQITNEIAVEIESDNA